MMEKKIKKQPSLSEIIGCPSEDGGGDSQRDLDFRDSVNERSHQKSYTDRILPETIGQIDQMQQAGTIIGYDIHFGANWAVLYPSTSLYETRFVTIDQLLNMDPREPLPRLDRKPMFKKYIKPVLGGVLELRSQRDENQLRMVRVNRAMDEILSVYATGETRIDSAETFLSYVEGQHKYQDFTAKGQIVLPGDIELRSISDKLRRSCSETERNFDMVASKIYHLLYNEVIFSVDMHLGSNVFRMTCVDEPAVPEYVKLSNLLESTKCEPGTTLTQALRDQDSYERRARRTTRDQDSKMLQRLRMYRETGGQFYVRFGSGQVTADRYMWIFSCGAHHYGTHHHMMDKFQSLN